jgi:glyoxylase I family protein
VDEAAERRQAGRSQKSSFVQAAVSQDLQAHLIQLEQELVAAQKRRDFAAVEALLADDFHEIGSSGRVFSKADAVRVISEVQIVDCTFDHFQFLPIDDKCAIVMYMATARRTQDGREHLNRAWRSSIWVKRGDAWQILFHQATVVPAVP